MSKKIVFVYKDPQGICYAAEPPTNEYMWGSGKPENMLAKVEKIVADGYHLILDWDRHGKNKPLEEYRKMFEHLEGPTLPGNKK